MAVNDRKNEMTIMKQKYFELKNGVIVTISVTPGNRPKHHQPLEQISNDTGAESGSGAIIITGTEAAASIPEKI